MTGRAGRCACAAGGQVGGDGVGDHRGEPDGVLGGHRSEQVRVALDQDGDVFGQRADVTPGPVVKGFAGPVAKRAAGIGQRSLGGGDVAVERAGDGSPEQVPWRY